MSGFDLQQGQGGVPIDDQRPGRRELGTRTSSALAATAEGQAAARREAAAGGVGERDSVIRARRLHALLPFHQANERAGLRPEARWWRMQSHANLSLHANSLLTGKRTGNIVESALLTQY